jgi:hypothetical protein
MQERRRSDCQFSKLNTQPACTPLFTLRSTPRDALRKTRCRVVRYSFLVGLFHFLLHAGLSRRTALACGATIDPGTAADSHGIQSRTAPTICSVAAESRNRQMRQPETYAAHGLEAVPTASLCACDSVTARRNGAMAHLELGRAYALSGDTTKAKTAYQDFLTRWKDAGPDIPILKQAKVEYARLP